MKLNDYLSLSFCFCISLLLFGGQLQAQTSNESIRERFFFLSNIDQLPADAPEFDELDQLLKAQNEATYLIVSGDFLDRDGLDGAGDKLELKKLDRLMGLGNEDTNILFLPGDKEWDRGGKEGLKKIKRLEAYIKKKGSKRHHFLAEGGCPGPYVLEIGEHLRIVALNTQWFTHREKRPEEEDVKCDLLNETVFWGELEDLLKPVENKNVLILGHHPVLSYGQYAGFRLTKKNFSPPIIGTFLAAFHQNIGNSQDLSSTKLATFGSRLRSILDHHPGIIYASGHEYDLTINYKSQNYHLSSGSLFRRAPEEKGKYSHYRFKEQGLSELQYFNSGKVKLQIWKKEASRQLSKSKELLLYASACGTATKGPFNEMLVPCADSPDQYDEASSSIPPNTTVVAGPEYKANWWHRIFIGQHYRNSWTTPINDIPYLNIDTAFGGLTAYAKGGAAQTLSLKLKSKDGQYFSFRSINKDPTRKKNKELTIGLVKGIYKDVTASQHPYGAYILNKLMNAVDIPNPGGSLYVMPDHPRLGAYRQEFKGMLGWLERRPKSNKPGRQLFRGAEKVYRTTEMYRKLLKDNDHQIDMDAYAKARIFDMWVADWDRHHRNWSWLGYGEKKAMTFLPFAKDRDKALSKMDGLYRVLDWPTIRHDMYRLRKSKRGVKSLNWKNRNMDRLLLADYTKAQWLASTEAFIAVMTDSLIEAAVKELPKEIQGDAFPKVADILKHRRDHLKEMIADYYKLLARYVHIVGSNKHELFEIERKENGDVLIKISKVKDKGKKIIPYRQRLFKYSETKEIRLFGLDGEDEYRISGHVKRSIPIHILGGRDDDIVHENSHVRGPSKHTKVYTYNSKDTVQLGREGKRIQLKRKKTFETNGFYNDDYLKLFPGISFNSDDGIGLRISGRFTKQKFNKPNFGSHYQFNLFGTSKGRYSLGLIADFRHVAGRWDLVTALQIDNPDYSFSQFYGLGNDIVINDSLNELNFYRNKMESVRGLIGLRRTFWKRSFLRIEAVAEYRNVVPDPKAELKTNIYELSGTQFKTSLLGPRIAFNMDFRDNMNFPTQGAQLKVDQFAFFNSAADWKLGGYSEIQTSSFWTLPMRFPLTFGFRMGGRWAYGETPFYYQSFLGQNNYLRGYIRNRFGGNSFLYLNSELRLHLGKIHNKIIPLYWGILGFSDIGKTGLNGLPSGKLRSSFGGGFYLYPYQSSLNMVFSFAHSKEESLLFRFRLGFHLR